MSSQGRSRGFAPLLLRPVVIGLYYLIGIFPVIQGFRMRPRPNGGRVGAGGLLFLKKRFSTEQKLQFCFSFSA